MPQLEHVGWKLRMDKDMTLKEVRPRILVLPPSNLPPDTMAHRLIPTHTQHTATTVPDLSHSRIYLMASPRFSLHNPFIQFHPSSRPFISIYGFRAFNAPSFEKRLLRARPRQERNYQTWTEEARFKGGDQPSRTQTRQEERAWRFLPHATPSATPNRVR